MSILIRGMEMPTGCWRCPLCLTIDPDTYRCIPTGQEFESTFDAIDHIVCDCPLVEVPPHGRLIDADDLRQSIKDSIDACQNWANAVEGSEMYARVSQALGTFVECSLRVKAAPTIIPAEKGE